MKKKRSYVPAILIGILGIAVTYFIDSSQNKQWQGKIREENNRAAEILRTEIKDVIQTFKFSTVNYEPSTVNGYF